MFTVVGRYGAWAQQIKLAHFAFVNEAQTVQIARRLKDRFKDGEVVASLGSTVLMFPPLVEMEKVVPSSSSSDASYLSGEDEEKEGWASDSGG